MGTSTEPGQPTSGPLLIAAALALPTLICASLIGQAGADSPSATAAVDPAEFAVRTFAATVDDRIVVRDGPAQLDVWLFAKVPFAELADRIRNAISTKKQLVGGYSFEGWTWIEPDRTYLIDVVGPTKVRVRMSRHLDGTLLVLPELGKAADAARWTPPYRPTPINMPHGPVM